MGLIVDPDGGVLKQGQLGGGETSKARRTETEKGREERPEGRECKKKNPHISHMRTCILI